MKTCRKVFRNKGTDKIALKKLYLFRVAIINIGLKIFESHLFCTLSKLYKCLR